MANGGLSPQTQRKIFRYLAVFISAASICESAPHYLPHERNKAKRSIINIFHGLAMVMAIAIAIAMFHVHGTTSFFYVQIRAKSQLKLHCACNV